MVNEHIEIAQKIVSGNYNNISKLFGKYSFVYKTTNERLNFFGNFINNSSKVLTVTGSGDQALNMLLYCDNIDTFDINIFTKYFSKLKVAGVKALKRSTYLDYFIINRNYQLEFDYNIYLRLREYLDNDTLKFWDSLYSFFEGFEIYNSTLFSSEFISRSGAVDRNEYLNDYNYDKLKDKISDININFYNCDIFDMSNISKEYDFIYLSNIINYMPISRYEEIVNNFNLGKNGSIISFIFREHNFYSYALGDDYKLYDVDNSESKLLIKTL